LQELKPFKVGGDTIRDVTLEDVTWLELPWRFEAVTPNIEAAIGLAYVTGLQGENLRNGIVATTKHFAGHGFPEVGETSLKFTWA